MLEMSFDHQEAGKAGKTGSWLDNNARVAQNDELTRVTSCSTT